MSSKSAKASAGSARPATRAFFGTDRTGLTIIGNTFIAQAGDPAQFSDASTGIFLNPGNSANVTIAGNTFTGNLLGSAIIIDSNGEAAIDGNVLQRTGSVGSFFPLIALRARNDATPLANVSITNNVLDGQGRGAGIQVGDVASATQEVTGIAVSGNTIANTQVGIAFGPFAAQSNSISASVSNTAFNNNGLGVFLSPKIAAGGNIVLDSLTIDGAGDAAGGFGILALDGSAFTLTNSQIANNQTGVEITNATATMSGVTVDDPFNLTGTLNVTAGGAMELREGGEFAGEVNTSLAGVLSFVNGQFVLNDGITFDGLGEVNVGGGQPNEAGSITIPAGSVETKHKWNLKKGGTVDGAGTLSIDKELNWTGGTMVGAGSTRFMPGATLSFVGADDKVLDRRTLELFSSENNTTLTVWNDGNIVLKNNAVIRNGIDSLFLALSDKSLEGGPFGLFENEGTFRKAGSFGTTFVKVSFNNRGMPGANGVVEVHSGVLEFQGNGDQSAPFTTFADTQIRFIQPIPFLLLPIPIVVTQTWRDGTEFLGAGSVFVQQRVLIPDNVTVKNAVNFELSNLNVGGQKSVLSGTAGLFRGVFQNSGVFLWSGGTIQGLLFENLNEVLLTGAPVKTVDSSVLFNFPIGTIRWTGTGDLIFDNSLGTESLLFNRGIVDIKNNQTIVNNGRRGRFGSKFFNVGTVKKTAGAGRTVIEVFFENQGITVRPGSNFRYAGGFRNAPGGLP
ncbi:MAG: hypothetical protein KatS3mg105_3751 [Gemmatales bacterium]|nr:MAG: hypothetical protein KatS3mg105_3751 [Gemmatales bacterium]